MTSDHTADHTVTAETPTPFNDLDDFAALPRVEGLRLSPDGSRLVTSVATLNRDQTKWVSALWEVDPSGERPARRLTRSAKGERDAAFLPDGSLLFCSARPDPDAKDEDDDEVPMLWLLPAGGGEASVVGRRPGGVGGVMTAREADTVVVASDTMPSSTDTASEEEKRKRRKDKKVSAILHESHPVRFWDHDLGPAFPRLFAGVLSDNEHEPGVELRDLTPDAGPRLVEAEHDLSPDGSLVATHWNVPEAGGFRVALALVEVATGQLRVLADDPAYEYGAPSFCPDGSRVAARRELRPSPHEPVDQTLVVVDVATGVVRDLTEGWDRWPAERAQWAPDGSALFVVADDHGRAPVFRVDAASGEVVRLTGDDFAYSAVQVSPDGQTLYAMRASVLEPPTPVRLDAAAADQSSVPLPGPALPPGLPGRVVEVETTGEAGVRVRGWLALPKNASATSPAPLLLWIHGGPLASWNSWSWRWNPWLAVARGYAVLLPDPALSTGYGLEFVRRGWGAWGAAPYTDLMAVTDAAEARDDVDETRTAAMGGSFGGYMANWVAGHTDRFRCIVTHASLWALDQFGATTDASFYWMREMTAEMAAANSPHLHIDKIRTPMLVVHGDKDYRVPIGEALRLWFELGWQAGETGTPHRFLYFPDENHWVLTPQHAKVWYQTVFAFLAHHVLGKDWEVPELLR